VIEDSLALDVSPLETTACSPKAGVLLDEFKDPVILPYWTGFASLRVHSRKLSRLFWRKRNMAVKAKMASLIQLDKQTLSNRLRRKAPVAFL
jgi:hypothetical protein